MGNLRKYTVGRKDYSGIVNITDPCYDKDVWCRIDKDVVAGTYDCVVWQHKEEPEGEKPYLVVGAIGIYLNGIIPQQNAMKEIGTIGVDAGLAGFFTNKPDYSESEWHGLCDRIRKGRYWIFNEGFFSESGYGDGAYPVYAGYDKSGNVTALEIRFM